VNTEDFYIDGQWVSPQSSQRFNVVNPANEQVITKISLGSKADVENAITAARNAFQSYSSFTREQRLDLLNSIMSVYKSRMGEVADAITTEMGAPFKSVSFPMQAGAMLGHLKVASKILKDYNFYEDQGTTRIQREAIGVCGLITPWNWPIQQIACKVAPALAAGCTMVLKPSELSPLSALVFADILHEAGVPKGVFNLVNGDGETVGSTIASHPEVDFVSFTGSTNAGISVSKAAAPTVKKVALELGGKSANILLDDTNFPAAVAGAVGGVMLNSGQTCAAASRLLVPRAKMAEVESIAKAVITKLTVGDPRKDETNIGPVANQIQYTKVQEIIGTGIDEGAVLVAGGVGKPDDLTGGYFVKPTIFSDVTRDMMIAREEIFGPVLCVMPYDTDEEAIEIANDSEYGLSGSVSSSNLERARKVALRLRTGSVHVNNAMPDLKAPFGGYKKSGLGREWGIYGFEEFLEIKSIFGYGAE